MTFFMYGWDRRWREYEADGMAGEPMIHAASDNFDRMRAEVGDVVYVVWKPRRPDDPDWPADDRPRRNPRGSRVPLGRELIDKRAHVLTDAPDTLVRFDREVLEEVARGLRAVTGGAVKFRNGDQYELSPQALMPMLRLTPESAQALDALLEEMPGARPGSGTTEEPSGITTAALNRAVERRVIEVASEYLGAEDWDVDDVALVESYDLDCRRGIECLHVEVKGTTGTRGDVSLHRERGRTCTR